jgi:hypothetical protein
MYSSQITPRTNLNCWILTAAIILTHSTDNCSHEIFNSHDQLFSNYEPSTVVSHPEVTRKQASVSPINPWSDAGNASIVASLLKRDHVTPPHSWVIQVLIAVAWQQTMRCDARLVTARQTSARLGTEKPPLRLLLRNRRSVFRCYSSCMA